MANTAGGCVFHVWPFEADDLSVRSVHRLSIYHYHVHEDIVADDTLLFQQTFAQMKSIDCAYIQNHD